MLTSLHCTSQAPKRAKQEQTCSVPCDQKCARNCEAVLLEKNDRSMSVLLENSSRNSASFRVAIVEATAATSPWSEMQRVSRARPAQQRKHTRYQALLCAGTTSQSSNSATAACHAPIEPTLLPAKTRGSRFCSKSAFTTPCTQPEIITTQLLCKVKKHKALSSHQQCLSTQPAQSVL